MPTRTKKAPSPTMTRQTNNTKTASTIHLEERTAPIKINNRVTKLLREERTITKWMRMGMGLRCRIPLIFTRRIIGNMVIQTPKKSKMFKSKNKPQIQIRLLKHIRLIVQ